MLSQWQLGKSSNWYSFPSSSINYNRWISNYSTRLSNELGKNCTENITIYLCPLIQMYVTKFQCHVKEAKMTFTSVSTNQNSSIFSSLITFMFRYNNVMKIPSCNVFILISVNRTAHESSKIIYVHVSSKINLNILFCANNAES